MTTTYVEPERADFWQLYREPGSTSYLDPLGPKNCGTHSAARMAMRSLEGIRPAGILGQWYPNGYDIRRHCYNPDGTRDTAGGVHHGQTRSALRLLYGVDVVNHYSADFDEIVAHLEATRPISLSLWYRPIRDTANRRGSFTFYQNHEIFLGGVDRARGVFTNVVDPLADGRQTGLYHGPGEYPISLIRSAAGQLNIASSGYGAVGYGRAYYQVGPATGTPPASPRLYRVEITGRTPLYVLPNGERVGAVSLATYTCTRTKIGGLWWYRIVGPSRSGNLGRWFKPNANTEAHYA